MTNKNMNRVFAGATAMAILAATSFAANAQEGEATKAPRATYTAEQAERGKAEFGKECVECHGKDLRGGLLGGPPLRGVNFENKYGKGAPPGCCSTP